MVREYEEDYVKPPTFDDAPTTAAGSQVQQSEDGTAEPVSALEHYEKAVEREAAGSLGAALGLYRKAFRVSITYCRPGAKLDWEVFGAGADASDRWMIALIKSTRTSTSRSRR